MHIVLAKLDQAGARDNEVKLIIKHAPEWVRTSDPVDYCARQYKFVEHKGK